MFLLANLTPQGGINVFAEYYKTNELEEKSLDNVLAMPYKRPTAIAVDSSAQQLIYRIHAHTGIQTLGATHKISEGIKNVRRMIGDGQGIRLLKIHPRCVNLIREMQSYRYDEDSKIANVGETKPLQIDDHGPSTLRYLCHRLRYNT